MADVDSQITAERALRAADRRKDEFLAMLGHELRNPLVPIRNAAEVLDRVAGDDARLRWVRETLVRQVQHVTRLVDDLLNISRVTRGELRLELEPVELQRAVERGVESATPLILQKRHRFDCKLPGEPIWVKGDAIRLAQVVANLLTNAAKYTDEAGEIAVEVRRSGEQAVVSVRDNGLGIAPGMGERIFDLFVQDERSVDRSEGGLGVGLSLVRHLVLLHGGTVDAHSEGIGKGCEFVVRLPLLAPVAPAASDPRPGAADARTGGRILVVDDDADSAETTTVLLRLDGHEVEAAADLDTALQAAARLRPQVVLLDLALPHSDGYEVMRRLRALPGMPPGTAYVAVSGFGRPEDFERTARAGFERLMVKPVDPEELGRLLRALLAR
jgi:two-component system CheB/CheR fusion protein